MPIWFLTGDARQVVFCCSAVLCEKSKSLLVIEANFSVIMSIKNREF